MTDLYAFFNEIWIARLVLLRGLGLTVSISLLSIAIGSVLGVLVGLSLTYGNGLLKLIVRAYTDFIRGTPVLVLVLASFYILSTIGIEPRPVSIVCGSSWKRGPPFRAVNARPSSVNSTVITAPVLNGDCGPRSG